MQVIFILVPSPSPTGPIKGAYALANALAPLRRVVLVFLKEGPGADALLDDRVEVISLDKTPRGWYGLIRAYRDLLREAGKRKQVGSISICLSADLVNRFCREQAATCSSVRGNLLQNYRLDYGWIGSFLAVCHLLSLRTFDYVVAMTEAMALQIRRITTLKPQVIGNFVDEASLEPYRQKTVYSTGPLRFVFVGSLSRRKQPELVIAAMETLRQHDVQLHMLGDGPLRSTIERLIVEKGLQNLIQIHGQVSNPYPIVSTADVFVLPSRSEGVSRAALEALHLGVPCVLRDIDGNAELIATPAAGALFTQDEDLAAAMIKVALLSRNQPSRTSLLPSAFRQHKAALQYLALLEQSA